MQSSKNCDPQSVNADRFKANYSVDCTEFPILGNIMFRYKNILFVTIGSEIISLYIL